MGNSFGQIFKLTSFGESHGTAIGGIIEGCPSGLTIDPIDIQRELLRRKPGQSQVTSQRNETDSLEILSGIFEGVTLGTPIGFIVRNENQISSDYDLLKSVYRPGHADEAWSLKYGIRDHRGGGRSSARETVARVVGGSVARMFLSHHGIRILAYVSTIGKHTIHNEPSAVTSEQIENNAVRCPNPEVAHEMIAAILEAQQQGDSLGGVITCICHGLPAGLGEPVFDKLPAVMAHAMMSLPASRSFESDGGQEQIHAFGSDSNLMNQGSSGGISNGNPYIMRIGFKPVSSISKSQKMKTAEGDLINLSIGGRHDPCVLPRAVPIVESMAALVLADLVLLNKMSKV